MAVKILLWSQSPYVLGWAKRPNIRYSGVFNIERREMFTDMNLLNSEKRRGLYSQLKAEFETYPQSQTQIYHLPSLCLDHNLLRRLRLDIGQCTDEVVN